MRKSGWNSVDTEADLEGLVGGEGSTGERSTVRPQVETSSEEGLWQRSKRQGNK